ncbi:MAG: phosphoadenosine phosphosulfate reductase family protein [Selenomonadaceae bacterium]|nr:phosphoadenosine phosphosulfate reductase family protein [Selenomonadaceae bacterium]
MYAYEWDKETGGYNLVTENKSQNEIRPVFFEELKFLQLDKNFGWNFPESIEPLCWAEGRKYFYRGELVAETQGGNLFELPTLKNVVPNLSLKPVDIKAMLAKNESFMNGLIQRTLKDIYKTFKAYKNKVDIFYVAFSGGKDSLVMLDLVQRALPYDAFEVIFGDTSMELQDTYKTVEETKLRYNKLNWHTAKAPFEALESWQFMGPPARKIRWCCSVHKSAPSLFKVKEILATRRKRSIQDIKNFKALAFLGIRNLESANRSTYGEISEGVKHNAQINFYPIRKWNTSELFLYYFFENLPLNNSYRIGLHRVGCKLCPMSSIWSDCIQNHIFHEEIAPFISIIKSQINKGFTNEDEWKDYFNSLGWKIRGSGKYLRQGEDKVIAVDENSQRKFTLKNANYSWKKWLPALGNFFEIAENKYLIQYGAESFIFTVENSEGEEVFTFSEPVKTKETIKFFSLFRNVLNKSAYCKNCRVCMIECPNGALNITDNDISIKNCVHCHKCLEMQRGCWIARSTAIGGYNDVEIKRIDRYNTFGLRLDWIKIYFENPEKFWEYAKKNDPNSRMGSKMFESFKNWGREICLIDENKKPSSNFEKISELGTDNLKLWGIFWVNMAYNSPLVSLFVRKTAFNFDCDSNFLMNMLGNSLSERTRLNGVKSLKDMFKSSPIGEEIGQGICNLKGRQVVSITRTAWKNPEPLVILYSLYQFAEHADGLYSFTLTDLLEDNEEREALSPKILFGIEEKILRPMLVGLANDYSDFIKVDFYKGIQENIFLNREKISGDIVELF